MENGEKLLFTVDTGCPGTILDKSLEPKLGKRLSSSLLWYSYYGLKGVSRVSIYQAPNLFLGDMQLMTSDRIYTDDLRKVSEPGRPIMGILGMDCLKHYCLQLDFEADTIRFLKPGELNTNELGKAFPLDIDEGGGVSIRADYLGMTNFSIGLDTGDFSDGALSASLSRRELKRQKPVLTNHWAAFNGAPYTCLPEAQFAGQIYSNLVWHTCPLTMSLAKTSNIGLRFLARHLVTLNFPGRTMYLQRRSAGPLPDGVAALKDALGFVNDQPPKDIMTRLAALAKQERGGRLTLEAMEFLKKLKRDGQLPGWSKNDMGETKIWFDADWASEWESPIKPEDYPVARTLAINKKGNSSLYNYTVIQASPGAAWHLQRAWKASPAGRILKDYTLP
jgi:hypothetical protein